MRREVRVRARATGTCSDHHQTCQESWHPSATGHQVLGQCLTGAWTGASARLTCTSQPDVSPARPAG
jgi:hypothetical protein